MVHRNFYKKKYSQEDINQLVCKVLPKALSALADLNPHTVWKAKEAPSLWYTIQREVDAELKKKRNIWNRMRPSNWFSHTRKAVGNERINDEDLKSEVIKGIVKDPRVWNVLADNTQSLLRAFDVQLSAPSKTPSNIAIETWVDLAKEAILASQPALKIIASQGQNSLVIVGALKAQGITDPTSRQLLLNTAAAVVPTIIRNAPKCIGLAEAIQQKKTTSEVLHRTADAVQVWQDPAIQPLLARETLSPLLGDIVDNNPKMRAFYSITAARLEQSTIVPAIAKAMETNIIDPTVKITKSPFSSLSAKRLQEFTKDAAEIIAQVAEPTIQAVDAAEVLQSVAKLMDPNVHSRQKALEVATILDSDALGAVAQAADELPGLVAGHTDVLSALTVDAIKDNPDIQASGLSEQQLKTFLADIIPATATTVASTVASTLSSQKDLAKCAIIADLVAKYNDPNLAPEEKEKALAKTVQMGTEVLGDPKVTQEFMQLATPLREHQEELGQILTNSPTAKAELEKQGITDPLFQLRLLAIATEAAPTVVENLPVFIRLAQEIQTEPSKSSDIVHRIADVIPILQTTAGQELLDPETAVPLAEVLMQRQTTKDWVSKQATKLGATTEGLQALTQSIAIIGANTVGKAIKAKESANTVEAFSKLADPKVSTSEKLRHVSEVLGSDALAQVTPQITSALPKLVEDNIVTVSAIASKFAAENAAVQKLGIPHTEMKGLIMAVAPKVADAVAVVFKSPEALTTHSELIKLFASYKDLKHEDPDVNRTEREEVKNDIMKKTLQLVESDENIGAMSEVFKAIPPDLKNTVAASITALTKLNGDLFLQAASDPKKLKELRNLIKAYTETR